MDAESLYAYFCEHPAVSTDTRNIRAGSIFFALKGGSFNGNVFAAEALERGACYAVVDEPQALEDTRYLYVPDALTALQELARYHRDQLQIPVIGITGTNGKTTTKELIYSVLSQQFRTYATQGNLNNHIGVPLTVLSVTARTEIAIIEMGANHVGEIAFLCGIARPTHGLITNVGRAHLEGFGSFEGVKSAKGELYDYLAAHGATIFLQSDNATLREMVTARRIQHVVTYGFSSGNNVWGELTSANVLLDIRWTTARKKEFHAFHTRLTGAYNAENILAAICVGHYFGVAPAQINQGVSEYTPVNNRSQLTKTANNTLICDYYNANASSMAAAIENLRSIDASRKVLILGDMFEMGDETYKAHQKVVDTALSIRAARTLFVGKAFYKHRQRFAEIEFYETTEAAKTALTQHPVRNALVLLKASRGMAFEKLVEAL